YEQIPVYHLPRPLRLSVRMPPRILRNVSSTHAIEVILAAIARAHLQYSLDILHRAEDDLAGLGAAQMVEVVVARVELDVRKEQQDQESRVEDATPAARCADEQDEQDDRQWNCDHALVKGEKRPPAAQLHAPPFRRRISCPCGSAAQAAPVYCSRCGQPAPGQPLLEMRCLF